jgi:hypothetical protein
MGASGKYPESNDYKLKETLQDEIGKTFVYDLVEDNVDKNSALNKQPLAAPKKASDSGVSICFWISFLIVVVTTIVERTSLEIHIDMRYIDPSPVESPRSTP